MVEGACVGGSHVLLARECFDGTEGRLEALRELRGCEAAACRATGGCLTVNWEGFLLG